MQSSGIYALWKIKAFGLIFCHLSRGDMNGAFLMGVLVRVKHTGTCELSEQCLHRQSVPVQPLSVLT